MFVINVIILPENVLKADMKVTFLKHSLISLDLFKVDLWVVRITYYEFIIKNTSKLYQIKQYHAYCSVNIYRMF